MLNKYRLCLSVMDRGTYDGVFFRDALSIQLAFEHTVVPFAVEHNLYYEEEWTMLEATEEDILLLTLQIGTRFHFERIT